MAFRRPPLKLTPGRIGAALAGLVLLLCGLGWYVYLASQPLDMYRGVVIDFECRESSDGGQMCSPVFSYLRDDGSQALFVTDFSSSSEPYMWGENNPAIIVELAGEGVSASSMFPFFLPVMLIAVGLFILSNLLIVLGWRDIEFVPPVTLFGRRERKNEGYPHVPGEGEDLLDYTAHRDIATGDVPGAEIRAPRSGRFLFILDLVTLGFIVGFIGALLAVLLEIPVPDAHELFVDLTYAPIGACLIILWMARRATSGGLGWRANSRDHTLTDVLTQLLARTPGTFTARVCPTAKGSLVLSSGVKTEGASFSVELSLKGGASLLAQLSLESESLSREALEQMGWTVTLVVPADFRGQAATARVERRFAGELPGREDVCAFVERIIELLPASCRYQGSVENETERSRVVSGPPAERGEPGVVRAELSSARAVRQPPGETSAASLRLITLTHILSGPAALIVFVMLSWVWKDPELFAITWSFHFFGVGAMAIQWISCWPMRNRGRVLEVHTEATVSLVYDAGVLQVGDTSVDLAEPFRVQLSRSPDGAPLSLLVEVRGDTESVRFAVPVEASEAFGALHAMAHPRAPRIDAASARVLWSALAFHAEAHGRPVRHALMG